MFLISYVFLNTVCLLSNFVNAQSINSILNADQNGILNGFPNGNLMLFLAVQNVQPQSILILNK